MVDGVAFFAQLSGGAFDDFGDVGAADLEEVVGLVGELDGLEAECLALVD